MEIKIDKMYELAKLLSEIHSHSMLNFYSNKESTFWNELEQKSTDQDEVDKEFFLKMSEYILSTLNR